MIKQPIQPHPVPQKFLPPVKPGEKPPLTKVVPWKFGVAQGIQLKKIRSSTAYFNKLTAQQGTVSSALGTLTNYDYNNGTINASAFVGGTTDSTSMIGGTPALIGGSLINTQVGTSLIFGGTIGTSLIQGGTVNAGTYQVGGTGGVTGSIVYIKTVSPGTTFGTLSFTAGLITGFN